MPNKNPTIVSFRSVIGSQSFQEAEMELPLALGKTISNETFIVDLAKMPHMLMAGATGQGKSVGLNTILSSLLYKKHPAEIKHEGTSLAQRRLHVDVRLPFSMSIGSIANL